MGDGQEGLAGAGGAGAEHQLVRAPGLEIAAWAGVLARDRARPARRQRLRPARRCARRSPLRNAASASATPTPGRARAAIEPVERAACGRSTRSASPLMATRLPRGVIGTPRRPLDAREMAAVSARTAARRRIVGESADSLTSRVVGGSSGLDRCSIDGAPARLAAAPPRSRSDADRADQARRAPRRAPPADRGCGRPAGRDGGRGCSNSTGKVRPTQARLNAACCSAEQAPAVAPGALP